MGVDCLRVYSVYGNFTIRIIYQGRKLDYDCKKRQQQSKGQVPDKEIKQVAKLVARIVIFSNRI